MGEGETERKKGYVPEWMNIFSYPLCPFFVLSRIRIHILRWTVSHLTQISFPQSVNHSKYIALSLLVNPVIERIPNGKQINVYIANQPSHFCIDSTQFETSTAFVYWV